MELYIVRHGTTDWNAQKKFQGAQDIELNENGRPSLESDLMQQKLILTASTLLHLSALMKLPA